MIRNMAKLFPYFAQGKVTKGFGRGSKELGIPTANFPDEVVENLPDEFDCGIYYGWASVNNGDAYPMVMSIGWNPYYQNTKKTMETHIMHRFKQDFYDSTLKICVTGYIRPEKNFAALDDLIAAIREDIRHAKSNLSQPDHQRYRTDNFFSASSDEHS